MFQLSQEGKEFIQKELKRYETSDSAIIPALFRAQKENGGWISQEVLNYLSVFMEIPLSKIESVFSFYTMFNKVPVGKYHIQVCTNISCALNAGRELYEYLQRELGVAPGEVSSDGRYSITAVECLGSCGTAPMMQINEDYYEKLNPEKAIQIIRGLK